jgi:hypothetical protein
MKIGDIISLVLHTTRLLFSLSVLWVTFGWNVRKARKAFEKELIRQGMAKKDAKRLGEQYTKLKNEIMNNIKGSIFRNR